MEHASAQKREYGFSPVVNPQSRVLVLGTFPGLASRQVRQYYGFGRNQFWPILFSVFGRDYRDPPYAEKLQLLLAHGVALWDVIESCETEKSLDSEIRSPVFVDLRGFLTRHPHIRLVCFNGGNAARFARRLGPLPAGHVVLPSTSPAHARMRFEEKLERWRCALLPAADNIFRDGKDPATRCFEPETPG